MYLFPLGKRILAMRAVSSGISGNFWGCRDIAFLLLFSMFLLTSYCPSPKYPSFSLSLSIPLANGVLKAKRGGRKDRKFQVWHNVRKKKEGTFSCTDYGNWMSMTRY